MKKITALLLVLALLLSGCFVLPGQQETTAESTEAETHENNLNPPNPVPKGFGLAYVPEYGFNPYSCTCITNRPVFSLVYESLFDLSSSFVPEPVLCERFAVSESGRDYLITICEGICFSDGSPLTARDVAASLEAARDSAYYGSRFSKVQAFTARDDKTLEITLYKAYENLPLLLDVPVVKADSVEDQRPLGTGPYAFSDAEGSLCLRRNHSWWQDNRAPVEYDTILLTAAKDPTAVRDSFEFGATSLVCADLNAPNAVGYRCDYELWDEPTTTMQYLGFNLTNGVFYQRGLRAAVTHIIDRDSLVASVYKGFAEPACLPCAPASPLYDRELAQGYSYDPEAFAQALAAASVTEGYVGSLLVCSADPARVELAHRIADALTEAGLRMEVESLDSESYRYRLNTGRYDLFIGEARLSGNFDLTEFFKPYGSLGFGGIRSPGMEQLCYDALENSGNCYDLYTGVMENGYFCPLLFRSYAVMANRGVVGSLQPAVDSVFHLPGGRSLADASVSYEDMTSQPEQTTEVPETTETEENP
ncbi:MAG: ABC transporter substrate-binding protein [Oscillospiraceae bacterium]|nr:ABC transporter substrate-binding protein [Oscillospiraceae bacterium]